MSKLLSALIAAGFAFGLNAAFAENVKSDGDKVKGQEEVMQQKEGKDQNAPQTQSGKQIPEQSAPSVGHPQEGQTTGQGEGVKKESEQSGQSDSTSGASMGNQDNSSGQAGSDSNPSQGKKKRRIQQ